MTFQSLQRVLWAAAMMFAVLVLAALPRGATGATYNVWSCTNQTSLYAKFASTSWFSWWGVLGNECPSGLQFPTASMLHQENVSFYWQWSDSSRLSKITHIDFTLSGGELDSGLSYEIAEGISTDDPTLAAFAAQPGGERIESIDLPTTPSSLTFRAVCRASECSGASALKIRDIKLTLDDSRAPKLWLETNPGLSSYADSGTDGTINWVNSTSISVMATAKDEESGVFAAALSASGQAKPLWTSPHGCDAPVELIDRTPPVNVFDRAAICPQYVAAQSPIEITGLADGRRQIRLHAVDALGNEAEPLSGWFGIDRTRPAAPTSVTVDSPKMNEHGWTRSSTFQTRVGDPPPVPSSSAPIGDRIATISRDDGAEPAPYSISTYGEERPFTSEGHYRIDGSYTDRAGNPGFSKPAFIGFDTTQPPSPVLNPNGWISRKQLIDGFDLTWQPIVTPEDVESGICGFDVRFDGEPTRELMGPENVSGNVDHVAVPANLPEGKNFVHAASVSCAHNVSLPVDRQLNVDASPPEVIVSGLTAGGWQLQPVDLELQPVDRHSGVASLRWRVDGGPLQVSSGAEARHVTLDDGQHVVTSWATDVAGNVSDPLATVLNVDHSPPEAWVGPAASGEPTDFTVRVRELTSGLASAALQIRRTDGATGALEGGWRQVGQAFLPGDPTDTDFSFNRTINEAHFEDGAYELRVVAVDRASNVGRQSTLPAGGRYLISIPLRPRPIVSLAISDVVRKCVPSAPRSCATGSTCKRGSRCAFKWQATRRGSGTDRIVGWDDRAAITGLILSPSGAPLPGAQLQLYSAIVGSPREFVATLTSGAGGEFEWRIPRGPSRAFEVVTSTGNGLATARAAASLAVRAGLSFAVSDTSVRSGQRVVLSGRLSSGGLGLPADGKRIEIQAWSEADGKWLPAIGAPVTDAEGRFRAAWRVKPTSAAGVVRLRAAAIQESAAWPFESGKSRPIRVSVRR